MLRKPVFWIVLFAATLGSIWFAAKYFSRAFPIVTLDLRMNREAALAKAADLATRFQLPPDGCRQVASFTGDQEVQNFVELEGGGTAAFRSMMAEGLYYPYKWSVRHFKPGETHESRLLFTPRGDPYGFVVKLPEKEAGAALPAERAREIAEQSAMRDWQADISRYRLVEKGQEVRPSGRIDHFFVYERPDVQVAEGHYRLRLVVGGNKLTELIYFVKVPEAFSRRHEEMRSANNVISAAGTIAMVVLYFIGGCGVGLFFLLRQRWILWHKPLLWGVFIAFLQLLAGINQWPLLWMGYDTAVSAQGFVLQQAMMIFLSFLLYCVLFTASFMAAESLSRRAFPDHPQMWNLWSREAAGSKQVLGRTIAGYLLVGIFFGYEVLLYFVTSRSLGWWTPSDILVQPDILATYMPWLSSIANSAQAGFLEECLFRAVPLACAALLGKRFGRRSWWIAGAMVLQALIFGSGHAGYANQPSYARVVELIIPSFMFGGLYLYFGLLPGIVLHYTFDVVWFALPLFVSSAPGILWNRTMVIVLVLVPLWVVFGRRLRSGKWQEIPEMLLNRAWQPPEPMPPSAAEEKPVTGAIHPAVLRLLPVAGLLGLLLWIFGTNFKSDAPSLTIRRSEAHAIAVQALAERKVHLPAPWTELMSVESQPGERDRFIWQTAGKEIYKNLMDGYLQPPHWRIRFVRFQGKVEETAEEYRVLISDSRGAFRISHMLPEARAGSSIPEQEARLLAYTTLKSEFGLDPSSLKEVSAVPSKLKARTDWSFTFSDQRLPRLPQGEKRITIQIAGDAVVDAYRFTYVPEDWERQQRDKQTIPSAVKTASTVVVSLIAVAGLSLAVFSWSRKRFIIAAFLSLAGAVLVLNLVEILNSIPSISSQFSTAQPFKVQMFLVLGLGIMGLVVLSVSLGLIAGLLHFWCKDSARLSPKSGPAVGLSLGGMAAGASALGAILVPSLIPAWGDFSDLGSFLPLASSALDPVRGSLSQATLALLLFASLDRLTKKWSKRKPLGGILMFLFGFVASGMRGPETVTSWLVSGTIAGALLLASYLMVVRFSLPTVLLAVGVGQILAALRHGIMTPFQGSIAGTALGVLFAGAGIWFWYRSFSR